MQRIAVLLAALALLLGGTAEAASSSAGRQCQSHVIKSAAKYVLCSARKSSSKKQASRVHRCKKKLEKRISTARSLWGEACPDLEGSEDGAVAFVSLLEERAQESADATGWSDASGSALATACTRAKLRETGRHFFKRARSLARAVARGKDPKSSARLNAKFQRKLASIHARYENACADVGVPQELVSLNEAILSDVNENSSPDLGAAPPDGTCINQTTTSAFVPKKQYAMLTFDDGLPVASLEVILPLLLDCTIDPGKTPAQNVASCMGQPHRKNSDKSNIRITYFATMGTSGALDNMDYLASLGSEIANHTVTHGVKWGRQTALADPAVFTQARWNQELVDNQELLALWTSIDVDGIVGMRAPYLQLNTNTFPALNEFLDGREVDDAVYYDSNITYITNTDATHNTYCLYPPNLLTREAYCDSTDPTKVTHGYTQFTDMMSPVDCEQVIPEDNPHGIWEVPMPVLGAHAMELPKDLKDLNTFLDLQKQNGTYVPMLIALHSQEVMANGGNPLFGQWMQSAIQNYGVNFVTMGEVVRMYESGSDKNVPRPAPYTLSESCQEGIAAGDTQNWKCPSQYDRPETPCYTVGQCQETACYLICTDDTAYNQAEGCTVGMPPPVTHGDPAGTGGFSTCNFDVSTKKCDPNWDTPSVTPYTSGAYPWLGNPAGNTAVNPDVTATDSCNYWPSGLQ